MMIIITSPKKFLESLKEHDEGIPIEEKNEAVDPTQAPHVFEEGGKMTQDELSKISLTQMKSPDPRSLAEVCP